MKTEEKTERQCGQYVGGDDPISIGVSETELLVNFVAGFPPGDKQINQSDRGVAGDSTGPALDNSRSSPTATAVVGDRLSLESLILAQDERWRRA